MERVDHLMDELRYSFKIVVPQNYQQNADAPRDIKIFDSFRHWNVSLSLILPHLKPISFVKDEYGNRRQGQGNANHRQEGLRVCFPR